MNKTYIQYKDTAYIILDDGTVARKLKPTQIHKQKYYNFIINKKQERINSEDVLEIYNTTLGIPKKNTNEV